MQPSTRARSLSRRLIAGLALATLATLALVAAGCGGGGKSPAVAQLGTTTETTPTTPSSSSGTNGDTSSGAMAFSECMRNHGVHNFPDPSANGGIQINPSMGLNPDSPTFQAAQRACQKLRGGKPLSPAQQAKMQQALLAFSACMRAHGLRNFPDPVFSGNGASLRLSKGSGLDPGSPTFQAAQKACQDKMPSAKDGTLPRNVGTGSGGKP